MSAGYDRQFEVAQEELAAHQMTASPVMQRELSAQMMTVCAKVITILDPQIRQMHRVSKSTTRLQVRQFLIASTP